MDPSLLGDGNSVVKVSIFFYCFIGHKILKSFLYSFFSIQASGQNLRVEITRSALTL